MPCINYEKPFDEKEPFLALGKMLIVALSCIRFVYFKLDTNYFIRRGYHAAILLLTMYQFDLNSKC